MIPVAGYCRVSTDHRDQANSLESQQRYFRDFICGHPEWELFDIYADEGITGTSTKKRTQFNRMINDAYAGKIRLIITKEVSRFSRNLLDTIAYTRELKTLGIGVIFLTDGFSSLDPDAELRLSIMGSIAQEESRKTSARVKWGQTRRMEQGIVFGRSMLGYHVFRGQISVEPEGAEIVRLIFYKYGIERKGSSVIAKELSQAGYKTLSGNTHWNSSQILKILHNEKYMGDLIQKKTITPDYLTHAKKYNKGEENRIIIKNHHEAIVSMDLWNTVQMELAKRNRNHSGYSGHSTRYVFSGKIICRQCGGRFVARRKTRNDGTSCLRWCCYTASTQGAAAKNLQDSRIGCNIGKTIRDELLMEALGTVCRCIPVDYEWIICNLTTVVKTAIQATDALREDLPVLQKQFGNIERKKDAAIDAYISGVISEEELLHMKRMYDDALASLSGRMKQYENSSIEALDIQDADSIENQIRNIIFGSRSAEPLLKTLLEKAVVSRDGSIRLTVNQLPQIWHFQIQYRKKPDTEGS